MKNDFHRRRFIKNSALFVGAGMSFPTALPYGYTHLRLTTLPVIKA